jgi:hypothetical protein
MSQQLWRLDDQTKAAVLNYKREQRYIAELNRDLDDFRAIFWAPAFDEQRHRTRSSLFSTNWTRSKPAVRVSLLTGWVDTLPDYRYTCSVTTKGLIP